MCNCKPAAGLPLAGPLGDISQLGFFWLRLMDQTEVLPEPASRDARWRSRVRRSTISVAPAKFFYRMDVIDVYYVGGFGVMGWVTASDYSQAHPDPLADDKRDIMQHMNADHKDALILIAKRFSGIEAQQAEMTAVDRLGFHLRLKTQDGMKGTRIAFLREVGDPSQTREVFIEMVKQARQG